VARFLPEENLRAFRALKRELDPEHLLQTDLSRRVMGDWDAGQSEKLE
jgi:FAD/FMN-containing dehydrogenase